MAKLLFFMAMVALPMVAATADQPTTGRERFAQWLKCIKEIDACSQVLVRELDGLDVNLQSDGESYYRRIVSLEQGRSRLDRVMRNKTTGDSLYISQLHDGTETTYQTIGTRAATNLRKHRKRILESRITASMLSASMANFTGFASGSRSELLLMSDGKVFSDEALVDGRRRLTLLAPKGLAYIEILFAEDPAWAPVEFRSYLNPGAAIDPKSATEAQCSGWKLFCTTTTEWTKVDSFAVPKRIWFEEDNERSVLEFQNWRMGEQVDTQLLDPAKFTEEGVRATIDFDNWEKAFARLSKP